MKRITQAPQSIRNYWTGKELEGMARTAAVTNIERVIRDALPSESDNSLWFRVSTLAGHLPPLRC